MTISEKDAQQAVVAFGTAMINDDKEAREAVYADMDNDSLKRMLRWTMRQNLSHFATLAVMTGHNPLEAWQQFAMTINIALEEADQDND